MEHSALHERARTRGVNPIVYWLVRGSLQAFFHLYFRLSRIGREHVPPDGPVIFAANHRSFLDPFVIAMISRRPLYYVAKRELFERNRLQRWWLNALGAFPVDRGRGDADTITTAKAILARGDGVLIFPEGTRTRRGPLGRPHRGVGRLALETGAPVVPVAVIGTEDVRRGWRVRPRKIRLRVGAPLRFPRVEAASPQLAAAVTDRIWPCVMLQWEWLGGLPPLRRAAVLGDDALAEALAETLLRAGVRVRRALDATAGDEDLVVLTGTPRSIRSALQRTDAAACGRAGVLLASHGPLPPIGPPLTELAARRTGAWAVGRLEAGDGLEVIAADRGFARQVGAALDAAARARTVTPGATAVA